MASPKRYYEVEFGLWVEEPDPLRRPACDALWNGEWNHAHGPRPGCFRPAGHEGEHHETRTLVGEEGWVEFYWGETPDTARTELRRDSAP